MIERRQYSLRGCITGLGILCILIACAVSVGLLLVEVIP